MGGTNKQEFLEQDLEPSVLWHIQRAKSSICALAVHAGHEMRPELIPYLAIDEVTRIREEDPYTDYWASCFGNSILTRRSRFEIDLNRPMDEAICVQPEDCWNLNVWKMHIPEQMYRASLSEHDLFYKTLQKVLHQLEREFGSFVVLDFHSYNHRRAGPNGLPAQQETNPDINVGTGSMDRTLWAPVVDGFIGALRRFDFAGRTLDVRENVNFRGRHISAFVHENFPKSGCALAIEVKKFFMDEWSGIVDASAIRLLAECFLSAEPVLIDEMKKVRT